MIDGALRVIRDCGRHLWSAGTWRSTGRLAGYVVTGTVCFVASSTVVPAAAIACVSWAGVPLLIAAGYVVRGCSEVERRRTGAGESEPWGALMTDRAMTARARLMWRNGSNTARAAVYLVGMYPALLLVDVIAIVAFAGCWAAFSLPLWYWAVPADGTLIGFIWHGTTPGFRITTLPAAVTVAACGLIGAAVTSYLVTGAARLHYALARYFLGPRVDPLAAARRILIAPGPLHQFTS